MEKIGGKPKLRMASQKMGPLVTDNGNFILDVDFNIVKDPAALEQQLVNIPGVIGTGLFINMAEKVFFGQDDGNITSRCKNKTDKPV